MIPKKTSRWLRPSEIIDWRFLKAGPVPLDLGGDGDDGDAVHLRRTAGFEQKLAAIWGGALDGQIQRLTAKLSGLFVQVLFNLPAMGILGYCGWLTLESFFTGEYLSGDFFMHAFWAIGLVLFLSFFILQLCIRAAASTNRITARAFEKLKQQLDHLDELNQNPVKAQLDTVLALASLAESNHQ